MVEDKEEGRDSTLVKILSALSMQEYQELGALDELSSTSQVTPIFTLILVASCKGESFELHEASHGRFLAPRNIIKEICVTSSRS